MSNQITSQEEKQMNVSEKHSNIFNEFFWICSGANRRILRQCPTEYSKYFGIGGTIFFTAAMATLSGGYAFYTIFHSVPMAVFFGIFWGLLIFNLDRFIVNTMYTDGKYTISWGELGAGTPRLIIAIFLGIVISTPLEMKIFEDEIAITIDEIAAERIKEYKKEDVLLRDSLYIMREKIRHESIADDRSQLYDERVKSLQTQLSTKIVDHNRYQRDATKYRNLQNQFRNDTIQYKNYKHRANQKEKDVARCNKEINRISAQIESITNSKLQVLNQGSQEKNNEIARLDEEIAVVDKRLADSSYSEKVKKEFSGFQAHMLAFQKIKDKNTTTLIVSIFITLLFIIIEIAPTFFKMMIASGPYDELLREEMERKKTQAITNVSKIHDDANTQIQISVAKNAERLKAELAANQEVLSKIAAVQAELLETAIEEWRKAELEKIKSNPSQYIKSNTTNA